MHINFASKKIILKIHGADTMSKKVIRLKPLIAAKAKANLATHTVNGYQPLQKSAKAVDTRKEIAKVAGVSHDTIAKVEKIQKESSVPQILAERAETNKQPVLSTNAQIKKAQNIVKKS